ncbi:hypothetical protein QFC22_002797 [Naganishia vaughanmartiniae]|uniref:Uncharacterized protein n=1 Tax=Naganishia vaughanmartiniae TaxID=1424756 RepID=A0ACC2XAA3_9TREE|nr:hypothetical protein QFC22_002797 [Naganishia vaughanmartiniae]
MALKATKFPKVFSEKVDIRKVNLAIMRPWVTTTITELAGVEDDIVIEFVMELLENSEEPVPDPRKMQITLGGFLTPENAAEFMLRLWKLLISAQASHGGIPAEFVEAKKQELLQKQEEEAKMQQKMISAGGRRDGGGRPSRFDNNRDNRFDNRDNRDNRDSRFGNRDNRERQPVPRDRDGRAFPQNRGEYRGQQGGDRGGQMRDTYIPSNSRRDDPGRGDRGQGRDRGFSGRPRDTGYGDRRGGAPYERPRSPDPYQGNSYRELDKKPDFVPRRGRYFEGDERPAEKRRGRSPSRDRSRSRSPSRTPPRRRRRSDASATPPSRRPATKDGSATPPASGGRAVRRNRSGSRSRSASRSATPPRKRRALSPDRKTEPETRKTRKVEDAGKASREESPRTNPVQVLTTEHDGIPINLLSTLQGIARQRKPVRMANLLEEIEGAITDEVDQENDPRAGGWPIDGFHGPPQRFNPQSCRHHGPNPAIVGNVFAYQQPGPSGNACYDSGYGHHAASSSSYSQIDSPSPATLRDPRETIMHPLPATRESMPPPYSVQLPASVYTAASTSHRCFSLNEAAKRLLNITIIPLVDYQALGVGVDQQRYLPTAIPAQQQPSNRFEEVFDEQGLALCSEKGDEWKSKLGKIGLKIVEFTGDTASDKGFLHETKNADVIITTPEKWDAVTRRMSQKQKILERLALMMLDEVLLNLRFLQGRITECPSGISTLQVHILNEERGAILETVVARMRVSARDMPVRVVALSATIPNVEDVARWLRPTMPNSSGVFEAGGLNPGVAGDSNAALQLPMAKVFKFGEDFRPTKLTRIVKGFPFRGDNPFPVINRMIQELFPIVCDYSKGKPVLIFAATRNLCGKAASALVNAYQAAQDAGRRLPWSIHNRAKMSFENKQLEELSTYGIAFHHGGLSLDDRRKVETAFRSGVIMAIVATSTLAVGVNLPAHTVILAGTYQWTGSGMVELSDLDVQQMIGRAGRPQYDTEGIAIILCSENNEDRYRDLVNSRTTIESCLHEHLTEHINTEIGLRTITCLEEGQEWIRNSFLYVRIQQNPRHYSGILGSTGTSTQRWQETLDMLVAKAVEKLQQNEMVQMQESSGTPEPVEIRNISATVFGEAMSANCLSFETMCGILDIPAKASLESLFHTLSGAHEFADMKLRNGEKVFYKSLAKDPDMRFSMPNGTSPSTSAHKAFILIQMTLGNIDWEPYKEQLKQGASGPALDSYNVFRVAPRICKAIATVALQREDGETLKNALALHRIIGGKAWPNSAVIFRQIDSIGSKSIAVLGAKGFTTFARLAKTDPRHIEMLLNRQTGFGNKIVTAAKGFPEFHVTVTQLTKVPESAKAPVDIQFKLEITADGPIAGPPSKKQAQSRSISVLALLSDGTYVAYRKANARTLSIEELSMTLMARIQYTNQKFQVIVGLDQVSGCSTQVDCKPNVPDGVLDPAVTNGSEERVETEETLPQEKANAPPKKLKAGASFEHAKVDDFDELEMDIVEPPRLPNGNWPCSHACSQQNKCKHVCCKEGSKTKPKKLKRNASGPGKPPSNKGTSGSTSNKSDARKKLSKAQHPSTELLRNSDTEGEDEKVVINRMLVREDSFDSLLLDLPQVILPDDSKEFDDPSFDAVLGEMDVNVDVPPPVRGTKRPASPTFNLAHQEPSHRRENNPRKDLAETELHRGKRPARPQPVKRTRTRLELDTDVEGRTNHYNGLTTTLGAKNDAPLHVAPLDNPRPRKLFWMTSDDSPSSTPFDKAHEFIPNGLLPSQEPSKSANVASNGGTEDIDAVSLGEDDDFVALGDLDQYLDRPTVSQIEKVPKAQPIAPAVKRGGIVVDRIKSNGHSPLLDLPVEISVTSVPTSNTCQNAVQGGATRSSRETDADQGEDEEEEDGLADFEKWIKDGGMTVK